MAIDARVRYTKMVIRESFIQLNSEMPFSKITVKDICDRAGINRSTFYRNYADVFDLKDQIENEFLQEICSFTIGKQVEESEKTILHILRIMKNNQQRYTTLHDIPSTKLLSRIIHFCFEGNKERLLAQVSCVPTTELQWYFEYICAGCAAVLIDWVRSGMQEPPEKVADFISTLIKGDFSILPKKYPGTSR